MSDGFRSPFSFGETMTEKATKDFFLERERSMNGIVFSEKNIFFL
ncbi:hypothetical protein P872_23415 [Rhodonellum psychrophilum GCM71 = DSM 17998]|uniref:Uncharacterized protein n=2 Tax=Rhodonellum TaxID=336827 RepID=U5C3M8_9BACT|nr:hypothetical protein P872_23415 [Rhodonellum psychrophilum GCM71 = DSM 17998]SDZ13639.1 hypothetical protein SAMN05444412_106145 [Rhodonellum ikkaensis]